MENYLVDILLNRPPTEDEIDLLYEAGQEDSLFGSESHKAQCSAKSESLAAAARAIISQIESVNDLKVISIDLPDPLTIKDIALLTDRTSESIRLLISGQRGPGGFPDPISKVGKTRLWSLVEVAEWWGQFEPDGRLDTQNAATVVAINNFLAGRQAKDQLPPEIQAEITALTA